MNSKVIKGIVAVIIFFIIILSPFIYNAISSKSKNYSEILNINIEKSLSDTRKMLNEMGKKPECIKERKIMKKDHGIFLIHKRDDIVRDIKNTERKLGLSSCINCHKSQKNFCNECHNYMSVQSVNPNTGCFSCHFYPSNDNEWSEWKKQMMAREQ